MDTASSEARPNVPPPLDLYSLRHLEALLGRTRAELEELAKHAVRYYKPFLLKKRERPFARKSSPPKKRLIDNPIDPLKAIQSRIEERLLKRLILPKHLLGGVPGKSIPDNAKLHLGARYLVTIDIKNFFPSITPQQVRSVWRNTLNCSPDVAYLLTGLTTARDRLPQGAPTSTLLANLVLSSFDTEIRAVCELNAVCYSSWVDDLAFSGDSAPHIVGPVIALLMKAGFSVSHQKIRVMGPGKRKILNKLVLGRFVTVQGQYRSRIRAGIHNLKCGKIAAFELDDYIERLEGNISYLRLFDVRNASKFQEQCRVVLATSAGLDR
jgi:RNA-directed DNA polymerase